MDRDREVATATSAKQMVKLTTVVIESSGIGFIIVSGAVRFEQRLRIVAKVVAPVDPGMTAAADAQIVFDPALLQNLRQVFRPGEGEVLVPDADREELDLLVGLVGVVEQGGRP